MYENGDFLRVSNLLARYVWLFDMADLDGLMGLFTPDALFQDTAGKEYVGEPAIRGYFTELTALPAFRGRRHHLDNLWLQPDGDGYAARCYWTVTRWRTAENAKVIESVGYSTDQFVRSPDGFRIAARRVHHWRDDNCPWAPDGTAI
ncbi:nuclear transport factor 2 family protein [Aquibium carbonis]|nr:nuclear transport factor 2 family protein [Aquibium carbonis]